tara:strand:- start:939 stop:1043 length:105 start_codon:yes stop_codon:yes gene_type:complete
MGDVKPTAESFREAKLKGDSDKEVSVFSSNRKAE